MIFQYYIYIYVTYNIMSFTYVYYPTPNLNCPIFILKKQQTKILIKLRDIGQKIPGFTRPPHHSRSSRFQRFCPYPCRSLRIFDTYEASRSCCLSLFFLLIQQDDSITSYMLVHPGDKPKVIFFTLLKVRLLGFYLHNSRGNRLQIGEYNLDRWG